MILDAAAYADEMHPGAFGGFAIYRAVADVNCAGRIDAGAFQAKLQDVRRGLGTDLVESACDRVEHSLEAKVLDERGHGGRSIGREREFVAPLEVEHERRQF